MPYRDKDLGRINQRERSKRWKDSHPEDAKLSRQTRYWSNPEAQRARSRKWYWENRSRALESSKNRQQLSRYHLTQEQLDALGNCCAICGAISGNSKGHRLHIDHDHETRVVRGKLCSLCNRGIGCFKNSSELLRKAAVYLQLD